MFREHCAASRQANEAVGLGVEAVNRQKRQPNGG